MCIRDRLSSHSTSGEFNSARKSTDAEKVPPSETYLSMRNMNESGMPIGYSSTPSAASDWTVWCSGV
eukprot:3651467-Pyramimonas_sp.AAC.2